MNIDFISSQITDTNVDQSTTNHFSYVLLQRDTAYSPYNTHDVKIGNGSLSQLDFLICDNNSGRVKTELSHWSMLLEVDCY